MDHPGPWPPPLWGEPPAPGRPARPAGGYRHPGPGSAASPGSGHAHRRWCAPWWSARLVTGPALAPVLPGSSRVPFVGAGGMLVGPDDAGVDLGVPVELPGTVGLGPQRGLDLRPGAVRPASAQIACRPSPRAHSARGRSRHGTPLRTRNKIPLRTWRWSRQRPPRWGVIAGSRGASRSHSWSVISNRRLMPGFYRTPCPRPKPTHQSEKHTLAAARFSRCRSGPAGTRADRRSRARPCGRPDPIAAILDR
jgi:hypothetical protein